MGRASHLFPIMVIALALSLTVPPTSVRGDDSVTVQLDVDASEFFGNSLTYQWRATDGQIITPNSKTTNWTLPNGPGIHFAYVLVSNGKGGYTEGRIAVNTDGNPTTTAGPSNQYGVAPPVPVPSFPQTMIQIKGTLILDDSSYCGIVNPFFGVNVSATAQFEDNAGKLLGQPMVLDPHAFGQFIIDDDPSGAKLVFTCETATLTVPRSAFDTSFFIIRGTSRPEVKSMSATLNGKEVGIFPVPPVIPPGILPSDFLAGRESDKSIGPPSQFLTFALLDDRKSGCEYYKSVGAVENCDDAGNYIGATLTFDAWRRAAQIDGSSSKEVSAVFVNKTDLNLTRDHHSVQIQNTAAYVCNHPGPAPDPNTDPTGLFPSSFAIDAAIDAVRRVDASHPQGLNLIACVAMDRMPITSVTGQPIRGPNGEIFVRFLIFGPNGDLLPSVNLDGNGEKFVSGACVVCHGGIALHGTGDRGSYFLPYDVDNFEFHSQEDQQAAIYMLNLYAKQVDDDIAGTNNQPDQATAFNNLFNGWYTHPPMFNSKTWFPPTVYQTSESQSFYLNVVAPNCRTCHIAFNGINFERTDPVTLTGFVRNYVCGEALAAYIASAGSMVDPEGSADSYVMPNSMVTFNRFWLSDRPSVVGQPPGTVDQPRAFMDHYNIINHPDPMHPALSCHLP
jgi:hypothetical protein